MALASLSCSLSSRDGVASTPAAYVVGWSVKRRVPCRSHAAKRKLSAAGRLRRTCAKLHAATRGDEHGARQNRVGVACRFRAKADSLVPFGLNEHAAPAEAVLQNPGLGFGGAVISPHLEEGAAREGLAGACVDEEGAQDGPVLASRG